jgi:hypothetical protein
MIDVFFMIKFWFLGEPLLGYSPVWQRPFHNQKMTQIAENQCVTVFVICLKLYE